MKPAPDSAVSVVLATMPYAHVMRPSIALGILKSCLQANGISCRVEYANLAFASSVGVAVNAFLMHLRTDALLGEWTFAGAAFRDDADGRNDPSRILGRARTVQPPNIPAAALDDREFAELFRQLRAWAPHFVDETARRILSQHPRIVGCTSTFEQHCASLALLRRIKELAPGTTTLLGGANCEKEMGWATIKNCPWVDYVVSGEADGLIVPLCEQILEADAGRSPDGIPEGVLAQSHVRLGRARAFPAGRIPRAVVTRMNESPAPDYADYFAQLRECSIRDFITPALAVESSRGCWWGQKSHCTFCGLNGEGMNFRAKDAEQVLQEWEQLFELHGVRKMTVVDNIIDLKHVKNLLPRLAEAGAPFELFYETKANLRREQVRLMAEAGVTKIQPGIEGLHDDLLRLMKKGNSAAINIQLLKYTREVGMMTTWMLLVGFPRENPAWHAEVAEWLPLVYHLQPPNAMVHIRYDRFSVYFQEAGDFGLRLVPFPGYAEVYPFAAEDLADLAYFFYDADRPDRTTATPESLALGARVQEWIKSHARPIPPVFCYDDTGEELHFFDTRPVAPERRTTLSGDAREIYLACDTAREETALARQFCEESRPMVGGRSFQEILDDLTHRKLVLRVHGQVLALACEGSVPQLGSQRDFPNGYVEKFDPAETPSVQAAWQRLKSGSPHLEKLLARQSLIP